MKKINCYNCGQYTEVTVALPITTDLKETWELSDNMARLFNYREGIACSLCGVNLRAQGLARSILLSKFGYGCSNLQEWVEEANRNKLKVCELNSCHELHKTLKKIKGLTYAEFGTPTEQNIEKLTYNSKSFDLVLHSETLEHVSDPGTAMDECRRVLNDNGLVLFTTPIVWSRLTRRRAEIVNGLRKDLLPPSYHGKIAEDYIVFQEYGRDIDKILGVDVLYIDWKHQNYVFVSTSKKASISSMKKLKLRAMERKALTRKAIIL